MQIHSVQEQTIQGQIDRLKQAHVKVKETAPFQDPIREFARASKVEGLVRNWLTYPIEERKRLIVNEFAFRQKYAGDEREGRLPESDSSYEAWKLERWRGLNVIIQEESRAKAGNRCPEVAIAAIKHLFPEHNWKVSAPAQAPLK